MWSKSYKLNCLVGNRSTLVEEPNRRSKCAVVITNHITTIFINHSQDEQRVGMRQNRW